MLVMTFQWHLIISAINHTRNKGNFIHTSSISTNIIPPINFTTNLNCLSEIANKNPLEGVINTKNFQILCHQKLPVITSYNKWFYKEQQEKNPTTRPQNQFSWIYGTSFCPWRIVMNKIGLGKKSKNCLKNTCLFSIEKEIMSSK